MSRPTWARWVTRISLILALVALVFTIRDIGLRTIATYFRRIGWWWIAVALLEVMITSLDAVAIRAFLSPEQGKVKLRSAVLSQLAGRAVNAVTPSGNLGEAVKVSVLVEHVSQSRAVSTILLYNVVSFSVELMIVAVAAPDHGDAGRDAFERARPDDPDLRRVLGARDRPLHAGPARHARELRARGDPDLDPGARDRPAVDLEQPDAVAISVIADALRALGGPAARGRQQDAPVLGGSPPRSRAWHRGGDRVAASRSMLLVAADPCTRVGESITLGFVAAYTVGGFIIYMMSSLVPMGVGISEGGNYALFRVLGENPARGVTLVLARRVTLIVYAAIGLVLVTASETVQRARERQAERAVGSAPLPVHTEVRLVTAPPPVTSAPVTKTAD